MKIYVNMYIKPVLSTLVFITLLLISYPPDIAGQEMVYPVIKNFGGIYDITYAEVKVDPADNYQIVIDVFSPSDNKSDINPALNNVARMINLHAISGLPKEQLSVVLAIHGGATYAILNDASYKAQYDTLNPNTLLIKELDEAGVKLTVCGQSLIGRAIAPNEINKHIKIATSMLTTVTTYQNKGYHLLKF
jgi:intracellular sulfur oxidation DsrE/DsrF family protein